MKDDEMVWTEEEAGEIGIIMDSQPELLRVAKMALGFLDMFADCTYMAEPEMRSYARTLRENLEGVIAKAERKVTP